jgi:CCR4-NOT transcription complex subunit 9
MNSNDNSGGGGGGGSSVGGFNLLSTSSIIGSSNSNNNNGGGSGVTTGLSLLNAVGGNSSMSNNNNNISGFLGSSSSFPVGNVGPSSSSRLPLSSSSSLLHGGGAAGGAGDTLLSATSGDASGGNQYLFQQQQAQQPASSSAGLLSLGGTVLTSSTGLIGGGMSSSTSSNSGGLTTQAIGSSRVVTNGVVPSSLSQQSQPQQVGGGGTTASSSTSSIDELHMLVLQLVNQDQREGVLLELSKKRESFPDLAPILWHTVGTVAALLQEIVAIYPLLTPPTLTSHASNRVCNALALLQCVASHPDTRGLFLNAHVPLYLYPFLNTQSKSRPFEYLRLTSLGVIGALVKMDDADVINFLLQTEIIPLCLRIMESGSELSKTVATFIVQKILLDDVGLGYVCATAERFYAVSTVLNNMVGNLVSSPSVRLLKHIVRCYLRLSENTRARDALRQALPVSLRDDTFAVSLRDDMTVKKWLSQLLSVVGPPDASLPTGAHATGGMMGSS